MKLSQWAKEQGVNYMTAYRWFKNGTLPKHLNAYQAPTGTIIVQKQEILQPEEDESELIKDLLSVIKKHKKIKKEIQSD